MAGINVKVVSERLGHGSVSFTLDTYAHVMNRPRRRARARSLANIARPSTVKKSGTFRSDPAALFLSELPGEARLRCRALDLNSRARCARTNCRSQSDGSAAIGLLGAVRFASFETSISHTTAPRMTAPPTSVVAPGV
jgi:hypothetical protein